MRTSIQWTRVQRCDDRWNEKGWMPKEKKCPTNVLTEQINKLDTKT